WHISPGDAVCGFGNQHRDIIAVAVEVPIEHCGDKTRVALSQSGIKLQVPARHQTVGMHDQRRLAAPRITELGDLAHLETRGAVKGDHLAGAPVSDYHSGDIADAAEA